MVYDRRLSIIIEFQQQFSFSHAIGCIDGTPIPIQNNHLKRLMITSLTNFVCQAVCNATFQFTNVEVKWPGSAHDARGFAICQIQQAFLDGKLGFFFKELVPGEERLPLVLLGDPAYPLLHYVIKEFEHCESNEEVIFNQILRSARNQIECVLARLKVRWWILLRPLDFPVIMTALRLVRTITKNQCIVILIMSQKEILLEKDKK